MALNIVQKPGLQHYLICANMAVGVFKVQVVYIWFFMLMLPSLVLLRVFFFSYNPLGLYQQVIKASSCLYDHQFFIQH